MQILCHEGKANINLVDANGDTLLHYAAVTQGNASLYIRYLIDKQGLSAFTKNKAEQTPRELAEHNDRAKFHRVIKNLKNYEAKETARLKPEILEQTVYIEEYEPGWQNSIVNNPLVSIGIPVVVGSILYAVFK